MPAARLHPKLEWSEELDTGIAEIDDQHKILVHTLNEASERLAEDASLEVLQLIVQDLLSYALYHFETEESLMLEYGYEAATADEAAQHQEQHRLFAAKVVAVNDNLKAGILIPPADLVKFLADWLVSHIMNTDRKLAAFLHAKGR